MNRIQSFSLVFACLIGMQPSSASRPGVLLQVVPSKVYKVDDPGGANTSSFVFDIAVLCSTDCNLTPVSARVDLFSTGSLVDRQDWTTQSLARIKRRRYQIGSDTPMASPARAFALPEIFDLRFYFRNPQALAVDSAALQLTVADPTGRRMVKMLKVPVQYYQQKTKLIVPFRGLGIVGQDWITNGGHGGYWNAFALDFRGLDENYAEMKDGAGENSSAIGWGRDIIAPAAGTVVYARNDVPTNPRPGKEPDDNWFAKLHDPVTAFAGNCVIIDHGNSEYSVMMHMQPGSVTVKRGDHVTAGQIVGKLGNSGDAFGPHLHYQLQSGPRLFQDQPLPFRFQGVELSRGSYINEN